MSKWPIVSLKGHITEVSIRKGEAPADILSITNTAGFVHSLDVFDKQIFSQDVSNYKIVKSNDLAYNPSRINVGSVACCQYPAGGAVSPMYVVVRCGGTLLPQYLLYFLKSSIGQQHIARRCVGAVRFMLRFADMELLELPLPPVAEQEKIIKILQRAADLQSLRNLADQRTNEFMPAQFNQLISRHIQGPPVTVFNKDLSAPKGWRWIKLTDIAELATGHTPSRREPTYWGGKIPWISLGDIREMDGKIITSTNENVTDLGINNSSSVKLPKGTVCFSRTASVGFVTMMGREMATSQDFVNWVCGPMLDPIYLMWALIQSREHLRVLASGSTHKTIYFPTIQEFTIALPSIGVQRNFSASFPGIETLKKSQVISNDRLKELFESLENSAFVGEL